MSSDKKTEKSYHHGDLRKALLDAAEAELADTGIEGFSLRKVARRAGVSHAAPAHHFGDVSGLLTALATRGFLRLLELREERIAAASDRSAHGQLIAYGLAYCDFAREHLALFRLCFASQKPDGEDTELRQVGDRAFILLGEGVAKLTRRTFGQDPLAMMDTIAVWSMTHGLADLLAQDRVYELRDMPPEARDAFITDMLERALPGTEMSR